MAGLCEGWGDGLGWKPPGDGVGPELLTEFGWEDGGCGDGCGWGGGGMDWGVCTCTGEGDDIIWCCCTCGNCCPPTAAEFGGMTGFEAARGNRGGICIPRRGIIIWPGTAAASWA